MITIDGIGLECFFVIAPPLILLIGAIIAFRNEIYKFILKQWQSEESAHETQQARRRRERVDGTACSICLGDPKVNRVSSTCGHSFCGPCLLDLFEHQGNRIKCPLCRQEISTIFTVFLQAAPSEQSKKIEQRVQEYNRQFDDGRPLLRRIMELPYVFRRLRRNIFTQAFLVYFLRSIYWLKMVMFIVVYLVAPLDLLPQKLLGVIGFVDDILVALFALIFFLALAGLQFIRVRR